MRSCDGECVSQRTVIGVAVCDLDGEVEGELVGEPMVCGKVTWKVKVRD